MRNFLACNNKRKLNRESFTVSLHRLVQCLRRNSIESSEIGIENDSLPTNSQNHLINGIRNRRLTNAPPTLLDHQPHHEFEVRLLSSLRRTVGILVVRLFGNACTLRVPSFTSNLSQRLPSNIGPESICRGLRPQHLFVASTERCSRTRWVWVRTQVIPARKDLPSLRWNLAEKAQEAVENRERVRRAPGDEQVNRHD